MGRGQGARRDDGSDVGLEEVCAHTGDVTDVITDVVGDDGSVVGVVLGDSRLNLAHKVSADIGCLGVHTSANARKESNARGSESESRKVLPGVGGVDARGAVDEVHEGNAEEADPGHAEAHDGSGLEGDLKTLVNGT